MLTVLVALVASGSPSLRVDPLCQLDPENVFFHVEITSRWIRRGVPDSITDAFQMRCDRKTKRCTGAKLSLELRRSEGGVSTLSALDLLSITGATLQSVVGRVAVISWGVHQFVFDADAGTVTKTAASADDITERGVGNCAAR